MDGEGDFDPTTKDQGATGGAMGGGDENSHDYKLPGGPGEPPSADPAAKQKSFWKEIWEKRGAKPISKTF